MSTRHLRASVHRLGSRRVNWFIVDDPDGLVIIDTGVPSHLEHLHHWLDEHDRRPEEITAVLLTHGHADHLGFARRLADHGVPVWIDANDLPGVRERRIDLPPQRLRRNLWRPAAVGMLTDFLRNGITATRGLPSVSTFHHGQTLDLPGNPYAIGVPGHTPGSTAFYFPRLASLFTGDALMTLDPMKGGAGATVFAERAADDWRSVKALTRLADVRDAHLYPGHGDPWLRAGAVGDAIDLAELR
jgi:glyoxylase-like metal-dependent hydrolase (beta-lactamase superfamily II)